MKRVGIIIMILLLSVIFCNIPCFACSQDNVTDCSSEKDCLKYGGYWNENKCEQIIVSNNFNFAEINELGKITGTGGGEIGFKAKVNGVNCTNCEYIWDIDGDGKVDGRLYTNTITAYIGNNESKSGVARVYVLDGNKCVGKGEYEYSLSGDILGGTPPQSLDLVTYKKNSEDLVPKCIVRKKEYVKGWNLIGLMVDKEEDITKFNREEVESVWSWNDGWKVWSNKEELKKLLERYRIESIEKLEPGKGYWVNVNKGFTEIIIGKGYGVEKLTVVEGWNLLGVGDEVSVNELKDKVGNGILWVWRGGKWSLWSGDANILNKIKQEGISSVDKIQDGEGFWVYK